MKKIFELIYDIVLLVFDTLDYFKQECAILLDNSFLSDWKMYRKLIGGVWELYKLEIDDFDLLDKNKSKTLWMRKYGKNDKIMAIDVLTNKEVGMSLIGTENYEDTVVKSLENLLKK